MKKDIYYFGYGPICNELVRRRREIKVVEIQAAYCPDYRLTFAFGGIADIVAKKGFEVHGLLFKLESEEDWLKLKKFESGNTPTVRTVIPYSAIPKSRIGDESGSDEDEEEEDPFQRINADDDFKSHCLLGSIQAYLIEHPDHVEDCLLEAPLEQLPQERYLKLIAQGMRQHGVDEDYVGDHIEACPFVPTRKPQDYRTFPSAKSVRSITFQKYQSLCSKAALVEGDVCFCLGTKVLRLGDHDPANPLAKWFLTHGHGKSDCTFMLHLTVVDPAIPFLEEASQVTLLHVRWAENHCVEIIDQYGMSATHVYDLVENSKLGSKLLSRSVTEETNVVAVKNTRVDMDAASKSSSCCQWFTRIFQKKAVSTGATRKDHGHDPRAASVRFSTATAKTSPP